MRLRTVLRVAALTLGGAWAFYVVGMNVFIRTRLFRNLISEDPVAILVDYAGAYSVVPGWVHVADLHIRGRDSHVEWILIVDRCDFRFGLFDFAHRRFHADHIHGDGLSLRVRQREASFTAEEAAALPPVPGFSDPPMAGPPPPELTDANYHLWSVWLEGVVADHVREIWIDDIRYSGDMQIRGRWFFRPLRWLDVGPAVVDARTLDVSYGPDEGWVSGARGRLFLTIHPFDVRVPNGAEILDRVSVKGNLLGTAHVATIARRVLRDTPLTVVLGESSFETEIAVDHGVLQPGMRAHLNRFAAQASGLGLAYDASLEASLEVDDDRVGHVQLDVSRARAVQAGYPRATAVRLASTLRSHELDLAHPFSDTSYSADITELHTESLRYWHGRLPVAPRLTLDSGDVTVNGRVSGSFARGAADGKLEATIRDLRVGGEGGRIQGDVSSTISIVASRPERRAELSGSEVSLRGVHAESKGVRVDAPRVTVRAPSFVVVETGVLGKLILDVPEVDVPDLAPVGALLPLPSGVVVEGGEAHGEAHMNIDLGEDAADGSVRVVARGLGVRVASQTMQGELDVTLKARQRGKTTDVSGSSMQFHPNTKDGWWAHVDVPQAAVSLRGGGRLDAHVVVQAQDASPITALLASHADLATKLGVWVVSTSDLHVTGEIVAAPSAFEARSFEARADGLGMNFELARLGQERIGAALLVVGPVRAGIDLDDHSTSVMLFGADPWFAARTAALRARERAYE